MLESPSHGWFKRSHLEISHQRADLFYRAGVRGEKKAADTAPLEVSADAAEVVPQIAPLLRLVRGPVDLVVPDSWVRLCVLAPPKNVLGLKDLQVAAAARFEALFGNSDQNWQIDADWSVNKSFLACAISMSLRAALSEQCCRHGVTLRSLRPALLDRLNRISVSPRGKNCWFVLTDGRVVSYAAFESENLLAIRTQTLSQPLVRGSIADFLSLEALKLGLPTPQDISFEDVAGRSGIQQIGSTVRIKHTASSLSQKPMGLLP
jgi:hypothetical protein